MNEIRNKTGRTRIYPNKDFKGQKEKSELDILCDKRKHTISVISEIHKQMKETQESMNFWIKRLNEEIEILENLNKKIERF